MLSGETGVVLQQVRAIFSAETVAGMTDAQLLERFTSRSEDAARAFEAIVVRHGPMVLGICRSLLHDKHEADDAFQATFLVLVRKARGLWVKDSLSGWLSGVAYRIAMRARAHSARRAGREAALGDHDPEGKPMADEALRGVIHEELGRLPESYRVPIVLCHLEGHTHEEAARALCCPVGTVRSRLARGREKLKERLARRGLGTLSAAAAASLATDASLAAVPTALIESTVLAATNYATRGAFGAGVVSATALAFSEGMIRSMFFGKLKVIGTVMLASGLVLAGARGAMLMQTHDGVRTQDDEANISVARGQDAPPPPEPGGTRTAAKSADDTPSTTVERPVAKDNPPAPVASSSGSTLASRLSAERAVSAPAADNLPIGARPETSSFELEVRLKGAKIRLVHTKERELRALVSASEVAEARYALELVAAQIHAQLEELEEQQELLNARLDAKKAEVKQGEAGVQMTTVQLSRMHKANKALPDAHSRDALAEAESEVGQASAILDSKRARLHETEILVRFNTRRLQQFKKLVEAADEAVGEGPGDKKRP